MFGIFRPKWKSRDADRRLDAVRDGQLDHEIIIQIARSDEVLEVRQAAYQLLEDLSMLYSLWLEERNELGRNAIVKQIAALVNENEKHQEDFKALINRASIRSFPLSQLLLLVQHQSIQEALFNRIDKNNDLFYLIKYSDQYGERALAQITDRELIERFKEQWDQESQNSRRNRQINEWLQARSHELEQKERLAAAKERLLAGYREIANADNIAALNRFSDLENEWVELKLGDSAEQKQWRDRYLERYQHYNNQLREQRQFISTLQNRLNRGEVDSKTLAAMKAELEQKITTLDSLYQKEATQLLGMIENYQKEQRLNSKRQPGIDQIIQRGDRLLKSAHRIDENDTAQLLSEIKNFQNTLPIKNERLHIIAQQLNERLHRDQNATIDLSAIKEGIAQIESALKNGDTESALNLRNHVSDQLRDKQKFPKEIYQELDQQFREVIAPLRELQQWERWSGERKLQTLCEEAENLYDHNNSSQYIVLRLRQLRTSWRDAAKSNYRQARALRARFDAACEKAFSIVEEEREINSQHRQFYIDEARHLLTLLSQLIDGLNWEQIDWLETQQMRQDFLTHWNEYLNQRSNGERISFGSPLFLNRDKRELERAMQAIIKPLNQAISTAQKEEVARRHALLDELKSLAKWENVEEAVNRARQIRREFEMRVRLKYRDENELWRLFRTHNEAIFQRYQALMEVNDQARMVNLDEKMVLLDELKTHNLPEKLDLDQNQLEALLADIDERWEAIGPVPRKHYRQIENERADVKKMLQEKIERQAEEERNEEREKLLKTADLVAQLEEKIAEESMIESVNLDCLPEKIPPLLRQRVDLLKKIMGGEQGAHKNLLKKKAESNNEAHRLALLREILLDRASPDSDRELRLQLQLEQLPVMMGGNIDRDVNKQLKMLYNSWFENVIGRVDSHYIERFFDITME